MKIVVPCTSANLGCGFDSLGIALSLKATFTFSKRVGYKIDGCDEKYQNEDNLIVIAYQKAMEKMNLKPQGFHVVIDSLIPLSRGLGSSATLIVAGVMAANEMNQQRLSMQEMLEVCTEIEGHPDNVAPALLGGLTASFMEQGKPIALPYSVDPKFKFCALVPNFEVSTQQARKVLPSTVKFCDAVYNVSRVAGLCKALETGESRIVQYALKDQLHEPYRKQLIHEYDKIKQICEEANCIGFYISGSGPTCMAIYQDDFFIESIQRKIKQCVHEWQIVALEVERNGAYRRD